MVMNMSEITLPARQGNIIPFPVGRRARRYTFSGEWMQETPPPFVAPARVQVPEQAFGRRGEKVQIHPVVQLRKKLGIKQQVLADLVGLGVTTIKRVEAGERVSAYTVSALCAFFSERYKRPFEFGEIVPLAQWQGFDG